MVLQPILVVRMVEDFSIKFRARLKNDYTEHEIIINSVLTYYWRNNLPSAKKFVELFETVIKRTVNELIPHKTMFLKYQIASDAPLDNASNIKINLLDVQIDGDGFKIDADEIVLYGIDGNSEKVNSNDFPEEEIIEKEIVTPNIIIKKYKEMGKFN